jgi:hypothetical protein
MTLRLALLGSVFALALLGNVSGVAAAGPEKYDPAPAQATAAPYSVHHACEPAGQPILDESYVSIDTMRTVPTYPPIRAGVPVTAAEAREAGYTALEPALTFGRDLAFRALVGVDLVSYYSLGAVADRETIVDLMASGGAMVLERPTTGVDIASRASAVLGDAATTVPVGSSLAVMNHGDEWAHGVRPYYLFWSDRGSDWTVVAGFADPAKVIDLARSLACQ